MYFFNRIFFFFIVKKEKVHFVLLFSGIFPKNAERETCIF